MCDVCKAKQNTEIECQKSRSKKKCGEPWLQDTSGQCHLTIVIKHQNVIANLKALGYRAKEVHKQDITSCNYRVIEDYTKKWCYFNKVDYSKN